MRFRIWPKTIRSQLLGGLVLLEALSMILFGAILLRQQERAIHLRIEQRLSHQANSLALQLQEGLAGERPERMIATSVRMMGEAPSVDLARITNPSGKILFVSQGDPLAEGLVAAELDKIAGAPQSPREAKPQVFDSGAGRWESVKPIFVQGKLYGYAWIRTDRSWDQEQITAIRTSVWIFSLIWISASAVLGWALARSITRPLNILHRGTRALMQSPEEVANFPLPVKGQNEIADLIQAFNCMVASIEEQRTGLSDTLSMLDSMLANAPIGLAFFDRQLRFVRVNRIFAEATGLPLSRHLGKTLHEVLPLAVASQLESSVRAVFDRDEPVSDVEISVARKQERYPLTWVASAYPVHTTPSQLRWVGLIVMDASERKRSEEALRRTEKLAATGRLAASIAHEINNPLEAITNLLYLLTSHSGLEDTALGYAQMAEHEVRRIAEITQQTLRFYRQSTLPARANLSDLLDSVLTLHQARLRNLGIQIIRKYDSTIDLYCFAGELRQVFANLVGNAIDAMPDGGRLSVRARRSHNWANSSQCGVRFQVSDTGFGMKPSVRKHIFEPFFTTKDVTGTGLGLWVSSEIVNKHQGSMRVRSHERTGTGPSGTIFELFFPDTTSLVQSNDAAPSSTSRAVNADPPRNAPVATPASI